LSLGLVKPAPGQEERAHRANVLVIQRAAWPRSVRIVIASPKGGVGKTPTALLLGGVLASIRGFVAVYDAADAANTLAARSEGTAGQCISDIAAHPDRYMKPTKPVPAIQSSGAHVFGSLRERKFKEEAIRNVQAVLDDAAYQISIADTANDPESDAFEAVIAAADVVVVPTIATADSVNKALSLLRRLQETDLAAHAVVAVTRYGGPETPGLAQQIPTLFHNARVGAVVDIPFDPHIATGTTLTLGSLSHPSKVAWTRLAATVVTNTTTEKG
jgi:MinD-like ATPase involved in chromosome partitioning or flagellar assembly